MSEYENLSHKTFDSNPSTRSLDKDAPLIYRIMERIGVKPAPNRRYALLRAAIIIFIAILIIRSVLEEQERKKNAKAITLDSMSAIIKPGTKLYQTIAEMEPEAQSQYLKGLKYAIDAGIPEESFVKKYLQTLGAALVANLLAEHLVNGNISKPVGTIAKSIFYSTAYAMVTLR